IPNPILGTGNFDLEQVPNLTLGTGSPYPNETFALNAKEHMPVISRIHREIAVFKEIFAENILKMDELGRLAINRIFDFIRNLLVEIDNQLFYEMCVSVFLVYIVISFVVLTTWVSLAINFYCSVREFLTV
ncbi:hypothetical protein Avbf_17904, partial [Armadillidium vulgare]